MDPCKREVLADGVPGAGHSLRPGLRLWLQLEHLASADNVNG